MKYISLTGINGKGKSVVVDEDDYEQLIKFNWCTDGRYALRSKKISGTRRSYFIYMHRQIFGLKRRKEDGIEVDHINGNGLDNRKENLRTGTHQQNRANSRIQKNNTSGYKCVTFCNDKKRRKKWMVKMKVNNKGIYIGRYFTKEEGAIAYNKAAVKYYGEFARLNNI